MQSQQPNQPLDNGETDREGAMARADLYKLANYSLKLFKKIQDDDQLEAWVQAKVTKAADYIASVYHYLEYEMKFSEYGDHLANAEVYSEGVSPELRNKLMEAKTKIAQLKKLQAEKMHEATVIGGGKEEPCPHCGGAGHVVNPGREVPAHVQGKVDAYKRLTKATHAAHKRMDANGDGVVSQEEEENFAKAEKKAPAPKKKEEKTDETYGQGVYEAFEKDTAVGSTKKTRTGVLTKTDTGVIHKNTSYADDGEADAKSGKGIKTHAKSQSAAEKKDKAPALKKSKTGTWGMENSEKFDNRKTNESLKGKQKELDTDDDGDIEADDLADLRAKKTDKKVDEAKKSPKAKKDYDKDGKVESEKDEVIGSRRKAAGLDEASKPSAGLTKAQKSATVKDAKAGKDIGKPGKSFDKVAKAAGGGEKGKKIAAAAMWKNKAKSVSESLDQILETAGTGSEGKLKGRLPEEDSELMQAAGWAAQQDKQGFEAAAAQGPEALMQFIQGKIQQGFAGAYDGEGEQGGMPATGKPEGQPYTPPAGATETNPGEQLNVQYNESISRMKVLMTRLNG